MHGLPVFRNAQLLERFQAGEQEAMATVYWACLDRVTRIVNATLRACAAGDACGRAEIDGRVADVIQDVFVKAFAPAARRGFDATRPYEPYLAQIARNVAFDFWRQTRRYVPVDLEQLIDRLSLEAENDNVAAQDGPDEVTVARVKRYLAALDERSRGVYDALYVQGLSQRDAARTLGVGRQVVRSREARLRSGLRRALARAARITALSKRRTASPSRIDRGG
jgi:RNA polymerase sigma factor (sigma-70 family)